MILRKRSTEMHVPYQGRVKKNQEIRMGEVRGFVRKWDGMSGTGQGCLELPVA